MIDSSVCCCLGLGGVCAVVLHKDVLVGEQQRMYFGTGIHSSFILSSFLKFVVLIHVSLTHCSRQKDSRHFKKSLNASKMRASGLQIFENVQLLACWSCW
jgi:hypothetical protein